MTNPTAARVASFWPDLRALLEDVLPSPARIVQVRDEWTDRPGTADQRLRTIVLEGGDPSDTSISAQGDGWCLVEQDEHDVLEKDDDVLRIGSLQDNLQIEIDQPWPGDVHPPVDSSEVFVDACRKVLAVEEFPVQLSKDIRFGPGDPPEVQSMIERVVFTSTDGVEVRVRAAGYQPGGDLGGTWVAQSRSGLFELIATVTIAPAQVSLHLTKERLKN